MTITISIEGRVKNLNEHINKNDIVAIIYSDFPVKFDTCLQVIADLTDENPAPAIDADRVIMQTSLQDSDNLYTGGRLYTDQDENLAG